MTSPTAAVLRRVLAASPPPAPGERCELCAATLSAEHPHVVRTEPRSLLCTCTACHGLAAAGVAGPGLSAVPDRWLAVPGDVADVLDVPVGLAFLLRGSDDSTTACYPGAGGVVESVLPLQPWPALAARCAPLADVAPDVEAVLLRAGSAYVVPVDACYELAGLVRRTWRGFDGGDEARAAIEAFFTGVRERAQ